jgi:hypothetical protein
MMTSLQYSDRSDSRIRCRELNVFEHWIVRRKHIRISGLKNYIRVRRIINPFKGHERPGVFQEVVLRFLRKSLMIVVRFISLRTFTHRKYSLYSFLLLYSCTMRNVITSSYSSDQFIVSLSCYHCTWLQLVGCGCSVDCLSTAN